MSGAAYSRIFFTIRCCGRSKSCVLTVATSFQLVPYARTVAWPFSPRQCLVRQSVGTHCWRIVLYLDFQRRELSCFFVSEKSYSSDGLHRKAEE